MFIPWLRIFSKAPSYSMSQKNVNTSTLPYPTLPYLTLPYPTLPNNYPKTTLLISSPNFILPYPTLPYPTLP